jgi:hypothetical protein
MIIYQIRKQAPKVPVKIQLPTVGVTSVNDSATLKEIANDTTITIVASIAYQIQCGKDSFGIWILSCATIEAHGNTEYLIFQILKW